jgi:hypothetical protein
MSPGVSDGAERRLLDAARATSLGDEVPTDPEELSLSRFGNGTLLVMAVVAHAHGTTRRHIRQASGQLPLATWLSLRHLRDAALIEPERRRGAELWFATTAGSRLGVTPYVTRLLSSAHPLFPGFAHRGWSLGPFDRVGSEHGPPIFRPSVALADVNTVSELAAVLRTGIHDDRAYALTKLVALQDPDSVPLLAEVAQRRGEDEPLARQATVALGSFRTREAVDAVIGLAEHRDSFIREAAARSLGRLGDPAALPALSQLLSYPSSPVREAAVRALRRIGGPGAMGALAAALHDDDRRVRHAARRALSSLNRA